MRRVNLALQALLSAALIAAVAPPTADAWIAQKSGGGGSATVQMLTMTSSTATSTTSTRFYPVGYAASGVAADFKSVVFPVSVEVSGFRFAALTPPASGTWTATLFKNGSSTGATCTVTSSSSPAGICTSGTAVSYNAGDWASWQVVPATSPTSSFVSAAFLFTPVTANDTIVAGIGSAFSTTAVNAAHPFTNASAAAASSRRQSVLPDGGTVDKLQLASTAPGSVGSGQYYDFSIGKNGTATAVTTRVNEAGTSGSDTTNSATVAAQDDIQMQGAPSATAPVSATVNFGFRYVPTTAGSYPLMSVGNANTDSATLTTYYPVSGGGSTGGAGFTEAQVSNVSYNQTITKMAVKVSLAPGLAASGKSRTFTLRKNGVDTALTCDVVETATTCTATGTIAISDNDLLSTSDIPTASAAAEAPSISYLAHR